MSAAFVQALKTEITTLQGMLQQLNGVLEAYQDKNGKDGVGSPHAAAVLRPNVAARPGDRDDAKRPAAIATPSRSADTAAQVKPADAEVRNSA